jgi:hypothetical protein
MARTMTLKQGAVEIPVNLPKYGYDAKIHMPIVTQKACDGSYSFFDPRKTGLTGQYDYRTCDATLWNSPSGKEGLNLFLSGVTMGRACDFTLSLGSDPTGYFPGGPDWGDKGDFTVRVVSRDQTGAMLAPWLWFQDGAQLIITGHPAYTPPAQVKQGNFEIGSIQNLMFPQAGFKPKTDYNFDTGLSVSGVPHSLDSASASDTWESTWDQDLNTGNAAALINYLITNRDSNMALVAPSNFYPFGVDQGDSGIYSVKNIGSENTGKEIIISVKHIGFNQWIIPMNVWLKDKLS